jgi:ATP-binding cassette subfamily C exporter for protease/lipase
LKQLGTTFVVMTHRTSVLGVADKMLIMRDGAQQAFGPRDEVLAALQKARQPAPAPVAAPEAAATNAPAAA